MAPGVDSPGYAYTRAIVGAEDVRAGKSDPSLRGDRARPNTLIVRFTRPVAEFDAWTTMPFFCAVPPDLPPSREGVRTFPGAGPYYDQASTAPTGRSRSGATPTTAAPARTTSTASTSSSARASPDEILDRVEAGRADWGYTLPHGRPSARPRARSASTAINYDAVLAHARA